MLAVRLEAMLAVRLEAMLAVRLEAMLAVRLEATPAVLPLIYSFSISSSGRPVILIIKLLSHFSIFISLAVSLLFS